MSKINICVCTFRRPKMLTRLLESLINLEQPKDCKFSIVVVDNDTEQSAQSIVDEFKKKSDIQIEYYVEPRRNISHARNLSVRKADGDFIAFIDDDEVASPSWFIKMMNILKEYHADGVRGPVQGVYEHTPKWIEKGRFFDKNGKKFESGQKLNWNEMSTSNCLLKRDSLNVLQGPFSPDFGCTGGEDSHMFKQLIQLGYRFVWASNALVEEWIPSNRAKARYLLRRSFRHGLVYSRQIDVLRMNYLQKFQYFIKGSSLLLFYIIIMPVKGILGYHQLFECLQSIFLQFGKLAVLFGRQTCLA